MAWVTIYDLRTNPKFIESVQNATVNRTGFGLDPVPALFGATAWWDAIEDGRIPGATSEGVVAEVRWGSMGDWPEWVFRSDAGAEATWTCEGDHTRYVVGLRARIVTAKVRWKSDSMSVAQLGRDPEHDMLIKVEFEDSEHCPARLGPGPFPGAYDDVLAD